MRRISRHQLWMGISQVAALRSTCYRGSNGAVIVDGRNLISIGYNGPASGEPHCRGSACERGGDGGCYRSIHAEANALHRLGALLPFGMDIYTTTSPCGFCARAIVESGLTRVFYQTAYRNVTPLDYLRLKEVQVYRVTPAGHVVDDATDELMPEDFE